MDTIVSVTVYQKNEGKTAHAALGELDEWEGQWSSTKEESPIYALNRGETVPVSEDMEAMLRLGQQLESETEGAYTLSIAPLVELWHIQTRQQEEALPTKAQI
ncbi:MAG: FAD:protein FMN transferase, partial [Christensenellales bacterium]